MRVDAAWRLCLRSNGAGDDDHVLRIDATGTPPLLASLVPVALEVITQPSLDAVAYRGVLACHEWLSSKTWKVDYQARRAAFAHPATFTDDEWAWACWSSGVNPGAVRRRQQAETWLWLALTGNSPGELAAGTPDEPSSQQPLAPSVAARLTPALVVLGARHLLQRGLEGTARADLSGWDPTPPEPPSDLTAPATPRRHHKPERAPTVRTGLAPLGNDPDIDRLIGLFGIDEVAAMLGLERKAVDRIRCGTRTPKGPRRRRVAYLLDLVDTLACNRDDFQCALGSATNHQVKRLGTSSQPGHGSQATPPFGSSFAEPNKKRRTPRRSDFAWSSSPTKPNGPFADHTPALCPQTSSWSSPASAPDSPGDS